MKSHGQILMTMLGSLSLFPAAAAADGSDDNGALRPRNTVELGIGYQSEKSAAFGRYTGQAEPGPLAVSNFTSIGGSAWDSGQTDTWEVMGTDLGSTSRRVSATMGQQGLWNLSVLFDESPFHQSDTGSVIFNHVGSNVLGLPSGVLTPSQTNAPTTNTATGTASQANGYTLQRFLTRQDFGTDRKTESLDGRFKPSEDWTFNTSLSHEHKEGLQERSLAIGGGRSGDSVFFPQPVDYDTDNFEATANYKLDNVWMTFGYTFSKFTDNNTSLLVPSPFTVTSSATTGAAVSVNGARVPVGTLNQIALPPSNMAHNINLGLTAAITPTTRLNVDFGYGLQVQDDPLLPYASSSHPLLPVLASQLAPLPRTTTNGEVETYHGQVRFSAEPLPKLDLSASYSYDGTDDRTPKSLFKSVDEAEVALWNLDNVPYSFSKQTAKLDAGYRFSTGTRLAATANFDDTTRSIAEVLNQQTATGQFKVTQTIPFGTASVSYQHGVRRGSTDQPGAFFLAMTGTEPTSTQDNAPSFRRFYEADRTRDGYKLGFEVSPADTLSITLAGRLTNDNYPQSPLGLRRSDSWATDADIGYSPVQGLTIHAFYTFEEVATDSNALAGAGFSPDPNAPVPGTGTIASVAYAYGYHFVDRVHTAGLGATWDVIQETLKIGVDYAVSADFSDVKSKGSGLFNIGNSTLTNALGYAASSSVPTAMTFSNSVKLFCDYTFLPGLTLRLTYRYAQQETNDPLLDTGALPNVSAPGVTASYPYLFAGETNPNYNVHLAVASLIYKF